MWWGLGLGERFVGDGDGDGGGGVGGVVCRVIGWVL